MGNIVIAGSRFTRQQDQIFPNWQTYTTVKYDMYGTVSGGWPVKYDGEDQERVFDLALDPRDDSIVITGRVSDGNSWNFHTIKYNPTGEEEWSRTYDGGDWDSAIAVAVDAEGNVVVCGTSKRSGMPEEDVYEETDVPGWVVPTCVAGGLIIAGSVAFLINRRKGKRKSKARKINTTI